MQASKDIITSLSIAELQGLQSKMGQQLLIIKFGAEWCGPCKLVAPAYQEFIANSPSNIIFADIDVDESIDLYIALKKNKMVQGIPVFMAFYGNTPRDKWFIPNDSVIGADAKLVKDFFIRCESKAKEQTDSTGGYSYYD